MATPAPLAQLRDDIDHVDLELLDALARRRDLVRRIAEVKRAHHLPGVDEAREAEMRDALVAAGRARGLPRDLVNALMDAILDDSHGIVDPSPRSVFVYGTLLRGEHNHHAMATGGACRVVDGTVRGALVDCGSYPGMIAGDGVVHGELVTPADMKALLAALDRIEGFHGFDNRSNLYNRCVVEVATADGAVQAWTYMYAPSAARMRPITSGDWRKRDR